MVERRWAIEMVVLLPRSRAANAELTSVSDSASRAEVASSRMRMSGFLTSARAIAMRCFWPPESWAPRAPTEVSSPSGCDESGKGLGCIERKWSGTYKVTDELTVRFSRRSDDLGSGGVRFAVCDVFGDGAGEEDGLLTYDADLPP